MKSTNRILIAWLGLFPVVNAAPLQIQQPVDCERLARAIKSGHIASYRTRAEALVDRYRLEKKFSSGKSGAYVALVEDTASHEQRVLKIFPSTEKNRNQYNYRELYYTCVNGFITYNDMGMTIDPPPKKSNAFPRLYEVGITNVPDMGVAQKQVVYPYMVFEYVEGKSLSSMAKAAAEGKRLDGYRLHTKGNSFATLESEQQTEGVAYQIVHLLHQLKHMKMVGREFGFYHADLNAGNVMVKNINARVTLNAGYGSIALDNVPLVTFIDLGHSTSNLDGKMGSRVYSLKTTYHKSIHLFSGSTQEFYRNLNGTTLSKAAELRIGITSTTSDMRLYRIMTRALFDSGNFEDGQLMAHLRDCSNTTDCVAHAVPLFSHSASALQSFEQ